MLGLPAVGVIGWRAWLLLVAANLTACGKAFTAGSASGSGGRGADSGASGGRSTAGTAGASTGGTSNGGASTGGTASAGRDAAAAEAGSSAEAGPGADADVEPPLPTDSLLLWLRADRGVRVQNGVVAVWEDQSSMRADAVQTAVNLRPRVVDAGIGDRPALEFDGVDDYLRLPPGFDDFGAGISIFAVVEVHSADTCQAIVELSNGPEVDDVHFGVLQSQPIYEVQDEYHRDGDFPSDVPQSAAVVQWPGGSWQIRRNGHAEAEEVFAMPAVVTRTQSYVGRSLYGSCTTFSGRIGEILVYGRAVTDPELLAIEAALRERWQCCEP